MSESSDDRKTSVAHNDVSPAPRKHQTSVRYNPRKIPHNSVAPISPNVSIHSLSPSTSFSESENRKVRKHSRWYYLRRRLTKKGVIPVNKSHPHFKLLSCIREGIRELFKQGGLKVSPKRELTAQDFEDVIKTTVTLNGKAFEFESYSSSAFATIRRALGVEESDYINSVAPANLPYFEFISNSKSGQDFFLSHDMQYMFKSNRKRDVTFFLSILRSYMQHFISYPHSLLVKYIGCYAIKISGKPKKYFLVMQSIFYPSERIEDRFDIKGCTAGRYQHPRPEGSNVITVLKDRNFLNDELDFGDQGEWFKAQIEADSKFLCDLNCMDYSLLIGRQRKHASEMATEQVSSIVERIGISISPSKKSKQVDSTGGSGDGTHLNGTDKSSGPYIISSPLVYSDNSKTKSEKLSSNTLVMPEYKPGLMFPRSLADGVENFHKEHRRLLPNCKNGLHIIEGAEYRYFLGVVDFLSRFDWRLKIAQYWKMLKYGCGDHSTKPPKVYSKRFVHFLSERIK
ncbi:phosphatidylinositol 4-phosphate 5-kinase-like protein 1 isoform X2 [Physella acuta]|uniref:phosphatidylinositol 4-phosphate 5-kinase-like protein 1 isoform X2 n=1 Tax=Physella acuta TaxID=109671 RepID=UPI0027DBCDF4|nr:phosphatidylinositol 4-phosphate 5-kinase-like protein 1 isoform X2 [Physella acuta]